jgi:hypothetical protein
MVDLTGGREFCRMIVMPVVTHSYVQNADVFVIGWIP